MGAIAVSKKEEEQIEKLRKELGIASKSAVIRTALKVLEKKSQEEKLRREIRDSVSRCAAADDREENKSFFRPPSPARAAANKCRSSAATYMLSISICASKQSRESFGPRSCSSRISYMRRDIPRRSLSQLRLACRKSGNSAATHQARPRWHCPRRRSSSWPGDRSGQRVFPARDRRFTEFFDGRPGESNPHHSKPVRCTFFLAAQLVHNFFALRSSSTPWRILSLYVSKVAPEPAE